MNRLERAAVAAFPELKRLVDLKHSGGWTFRPCAVAENVMILVGWHHWVGGYGDAIAIRNVGDAKAYRCDASGGEVWGREGSLVSVIDELIALPAPGTPGAPSLVRGRVPTMWVPGMAL